MLPLPILCQLDPARDQSLQQAPMHAPDNIGQDYALDYINYETPRQSMFGMEL